ncbi:hypothetical protein MPSEU_001048500 [Mayamaea pseudoterrestris]|nr:hypothetical protein MPSEU_001048500 [Mayamaea pseudoterrestris]
MKYRIFFAAQWICLTSCPLQNAAAWTAPATAIRQRQWKLDRRFNDPILMQSWMTPYEEILDSSDMLKATDKRYLSPPPSWQHRVYSILLCLQILLGTCLGTCHATEGAAQKIAQLAEISPQVEVIHQVAQSSEYSGSHKRYWSTMEQGSLAEKEAANLHLLDYAVGTVNTMYYDHTGGVDFQPRDFYSTFKSWLRVEAPTSLHDRTAVVQELKSLISGLDDPFSKYMTREELKKEMSTWNDGFLGLGAVAEPPSKAWYTHTTPVVANLPAPPPPTATSRNKQDARISVNRVLSLPVVTAVAPDSPAERAGLTVGDRIVAVGQDIFLGKSEQQLDKLLQERYSAENYLGHPSLTIAKPVYATIQSDGGRGDRDVIVAYRPTHVRLPTASVEPFQLNPWQKGNAIVHYELLSSEDSIFARQRVGYIRLTRFSKASTSGFIKAVTDLEMRGATSFIIDLRNNYGGVIQEAMLTASTLLRDPHSVLCYTMNSRGGFTTHDVEEYVVHSRYPGYLLSNEPNNVVLAQVKRENPSIFASDGVNWSPPSSFASLHEQATRRSIHKHASLTHYASNRADSDRQNPFYSVIRRPIVLLVNEGTASSAEVFASALRDNGRTVALVGTKTYGKGLIQHTFPMPDGGALKLTVAEYLTPALQHVTKVGGAQYSMGERVGGGILPDVVCESKQGIPNNIGADLCIGVAMDALEEAESAKIQFLSKL